MTNLAQNLKRLLICGVSSAAISACAPKYHFDTNAAAHTSSFSHTTYKSRYGVTTNDAASLRPACQTEYAVSHCGYTQVVPVYPVYQIVTPPQETYVEAPIEEPPVIAMPELEPDLPVYIEPEPPVYTPAPQHWPEPETPVPDWTPIRK